MTSKRLWQVMTTGRPLKTTQLEKFITRSSHRSHCTSCPSVCRPAWVPNSERRKEKKLNLIKNKFQNKTYVNVFKGRSNWCANFHMKNFKQMPNISRNRGLCGDVGLIHCQRLRRSATGRTPVRISCRHLACDDVVSCWVPPVRSASDDKKVFLLILQSPLSKPANICTGFTQYAVAALSPNATILRLDVKSLQNKSFNCIKL